MPREIDEESLRRMAHIIGPSGASSLALADFERRREAGENPTVYLHGGTFIVGPSLNLGDHK
jgi:hypothetical protein